MKRVLAAAGAAAAVMLTLAACSSKSGARVDPALVSLVPSDTVALVYVEMEELLKTPVYQKYLKGRAFDQLDQFARSAGLNTATDLWEVLFVSDGEHHAAIGRGKFSNEAEPRLNPTAQRTKYKTYTLIGDDTTAVFFMSPTVAAVGDTPLLKRMIDARDESNGPPAVLAARMKEVPYSAEVWSVYSGAPISIPANAPANLGNIMKVLDSIDSGLMYLDVTTMVTGLARGIAKDEAGAKELYDALRGLTGLAHMMISPEQKDLLSLLDGLQVTQEGTTVNVHIQATEQAIAVLANVWLGQTPPVTPAP